jgi:serine/threonine protein kinase
MTLLHPIDARPRRLGRYELIRPLAMGGMAELHLARLAGPAGVEKLLVIKRILPEHAGDPQFVRMFLNEARIASTLQHANVVHVYDFGCENGDYFLVMEYLAGSDVRRLLRDLQSERRPLPLEIALAVATGVAAGLHHVHEKRDPEGRPLALVHRDVSPQNIIVTWDGGVKLVDFGIAKATRVAGQTRAGALKGKLAYMSPDQARGAPLDRTSDVFSLSVVLWELTVGTPLFGGDTDDEVIEAVIRAEVPRPAAARPGYPPELQRIVMKGLARERTDRYQTAEAMQADLEAFANASNLSLAPRRVAAFMRERAEPGGSLAAHESTATPEERAQARTVLDPVHAPQGESAPAPRRTRVSGRARRPAGRRAGGTLVAALLVLGTVAGLGAFRLLRGPAPAAPPRATAPVERRPPPAPPPGPAPATVAPAPATEPEATSAPASQPPPPRKATPHPRRKATDAVRPRETWDPNSALPPP